MVPRNSHVPSCVTCHKTKSFQVVTHMYQVPGIHIYSRPAAGSSTRSSGDGATNCGNSTIRFLEPRFSQGALTLGDLSHLPGIRLLHVSRMYTGYMYK